MSNIVHVCLFILFEVYLRLPTVGLLPQKINACWVLLANTYNPSYSGDRDRSKALSWKNPSQTRAGGVVQGVGPEFKPQYHTHTKSIFCFIRITRFPSRRLYHLAKVCKTAFFFFETESYYVAQVGLELVCAPPPLSCLCLQNARISGRISLSPYPCHQHVWPCF
jgi:hypothetical protein